MRHNPHEAGAFFVELDDVIAQSNPVEYQRQLQEIHTKADEFVDYQYAKIDDGMPRYSECERAMRSGFLRRLKVLKIVTIDKELS